MAVRFYNELNNLSSAYFYAKPPKKKGKYFEKERVISRRTRKRKVSRFYNIIRLFYLK